MKETFDKALAWIKANPVLAGGAALALVMLLKPGLLRPKRRRRPARRNVSHKKTVRRRYNTSPKSKKAWQVKGSKAAKMRMARLRRMRRAA